MSNQESNRIRRIIGWSMVELLAVIGVSIALSFYLAHRPQGAFYYPFFFPFHFGWLGGIFLAFLIFLVLRWLFWPWIWNYRADSRYRDDAQKILRERYVKGEITKEQFEQIMHDLERAGGNGEPSK